MTFEKALVKEMKEIFGDDIKRIEHALNVTQYARLLLDEERGNPEVVIPAAILHDIGIPEAERKYGSSAGPYQEREGPPIARKVLEKLGCAERILEEVLSIIAHHHSPGKIDTSNFKILYDADWLVNLSDEYDCQNKQKLSRIINRIFLTDSGKKMARKIFLMKNFQTKITNHLKENEMSRADMFMAEKREEWVTPAIEASLKQVAGGGELSCYQAMEFARSQKISLKKMKYLTDLFKIRLKSCQLGCF